MRAHASYEFAWNLLNVSQRNLHHLSNLSSTKWMITVFSNAYSILNEQILLISPTTTTTTKKAQRQKCMIWFLQTMPISHLRNEKRLTLNSIEWFIFVLRTEIPQYWRSEIERERNKDMRKQVNSQLTMESLNLNGTTVIFSRLLQAWENRNR